VPQRALRHFNEDIAGAEALVDLAAPLPTGTVSQVLLRDDVLRSAWMFAVGPKLRGRRKRCGRLAIPGDAGGGRTRLELLSRRPVGRCLPRRPPATMPRRGPRCRPRPPRTAPVQKRAIGRESCARSRQSGSSNAYSTPSRTPIRPCGSSRFKCAFPLLAGHVPGASCASYLRK